YQPRCEREGQRVEEGPHQETQAQSAERGETEQLQSRLKRDGLPGARDRLVLADKGLARFQVESAADAEDRLRGEHARALRTFPVRTAGDSIRAAVLVLRGPGLARPLRRARRRGASPFDQLNDRPLGDWLQFLLRGRRGGRFALLRRRRLVRF